MIKKKRGRWIKPAIILGALVLLATLKAPVVSLFLTHKMQVKVSVGGLGFSPDGFKIWRFKMKNPKGFTQKKALQAETIDVVYNWKALRSNPSIIESVSADNVRLWVEFSNLVGSRNNWTEIVARMPASDENDPEVIINQLIMKNLEVEIRGLGLVGAPKTVQVSKVELKNISSKSGFPTKQLIGQIFEEIGIGSYIREVLSPTGLLRKILSEGTDEKGSDCSDPSKNGS